MTVDIKFSHKAMVKLTHFAGKYTFFRKKLVDKKLVLRWHVEKKKKHVDQMFLTRLA